MPAFEMNESKGLGFYKEFDITLRRAKWREMGIERFARFAHSEGGTIILGGFKMIHGIDLSHWQGDVDFEKLVKAGIKFCFLKFSEGTEHVDERAQEYLAGARANTMPAGAYHYFLPKYDPIEQADHFLTTMATIEKEVGTLVLPPVIDVEVKASVAKLQSTILQFLERVEVRRGVTPIIYTSPGFWRSYVGRWDDCVRFPLWVAHYGTTFPSQFHPWANWFIWQYTSAGRVLGCNANVDLNLFPGNWEAFIKYCNFEKEEYLAYRDPR